MTSTNSATVVRDQYAADSDDLAQRLRESRRLSLSLAAPLSDEDQVVQAMDDASPTKWHLGHTTWFYEAFILRDYLKGYQPFSPDFDYCFNSYYESQGERHPRGSRGLLTRPGANEVRAYREHVDEALERLMDSDANGDPDLTALIELGINHEQQHQELLLTDILALFARQPLRPVYREQGPRAVGGSATAAEMISFHGGIVQIGHAGQAFSYDNEGPQHEQLIAPFRLATRLVTNGEFLEFMESGAYSDPLMWLADGWTRIKLDGWCGPEYWEERDGHWHQMTLNGLVPIDPAAPLAHVSYYEAEAFARWAGKRLPTEFEWELAAADVAETGNLLSSGALRPQPAASRSGLQQMFGDVWEWTSSAYMPYRGYRPPEGAVGEYNGKFMCSQQVLRGASCVTVDRHSRKTYRNFFYPHQRWQFMGLRLAEDA